MDESLLRDQGQSSVRQWHITSPVRKKVQQQLAAPNMLLRFFKDPNEQQIIERIQACFTGLYPLSKTGDQDPSDIIKKALENPHLFVMKPQREGGGNNIYGEDIRKSLQTMSESERSGFILMDKIEPLPFMAHALNQGVISSSLSLSELGIFSVFISDGTQIYANNAAGYLVRTKLKDSFEGGVATGYAVLDSLHLLDI